MGGVLAVAAGGQCGEGGGEKSAEGAFWDFVRMGLYYAQTVFLFDMNSRFL